MNTSCVSSSASEWLRNAPSRPSRPSAEIVRPKRRTPRDRRFARREPGRREWSKGRGRGRLRFVREPAASGRVASRSLASPSSSSKSRRGAFSRISINAPRSVECGPKVRPVPSSFASSERRNGRRPTATAKTRRFETNRLKGSSAALRSLPSKPAFPFPAGEGGGTSRKKFSKRLRRPFSALLANDLARRERNIRNGGGSTR